MLSTVSLRNVPVVLRVGPWLAGLALAISSCNRSAAREKEVAPAAASAAHVETVVAAESQVPRYVFVTGSLAPAQKADVAAGTPGRVVRTFVERGTTVTAGALLAELDRRTSSATGSKRVPKRASPRRSFVSPKTNAAAPRSSSIATRFRRPKPIARKGSAPPRATPWPEPMRVDNSRVLLSITPPCAHPSAASSRSGTFRPANMLRPAGASQRSWRSTPFGSSSRSPRRR